MQRIIVIKKTNSPRIYLKGQAASEPPHFFVLTVHGENVLQRKNLALVIYQNKYHSRERVKQSRASW